MQWFTPPYYKDERQRAQLLGDSSGDGAWVDRVKIPGGGRVLAHTHPHDEVVTVIEGTWYVIGKTGETICKTNCTVNDTPLELRGLHLWSCNFRFEAK